MNYLVKSLLVFIGCCIAVVTAANGGTTIVANSCSQTDVQHAIDSATDGDVVTVPKGICSWTGPVSLANKAIVLKGAGIDNTVIIDKTSGAWNQVPLWISGREGKPFRITGFTFKCDGLNPSGCGDSHGVIQIRGNCKTWRIDHNKFDSMPNRGIWVGDRINLTYGVIDHNLFEGSVAFNSVYVDGDNVEAWTTDPLSLGTGKAVYVEDNVFNFSVAYEGRAAVDGGYGGRFVFRHNKVTNQMVGSHGADSNPGRSTHSQEIYDNIFTTKNNQTLTRAVFIRGGTAVIFDNTITGRYSASVHLTNYRSCENKTPSMPHNFLTKQGHPACDGTCPLDGNTDQYGYPCLDQPGRTTKQALAPIYSWGNILNGRASKVTVRNFPDCDAPANVIRENRDYYNCDNKADCAAKPFPLVYTPYEYPHPLTRLNTPLDAGDSK